MTAPLDRLLPLPLHAELGAGSLTLSPHTRITAIGLDVSSPTIGHLVADVQRACGLHLSRGGEPVLGDIRLQLEPTATEHGAEGYELTVDDGGVHLTAATEHGLWNATRTLVQLFPHEPGGTTLPLVHILDRPRFEWRGAMLDVARHFFNVDQVLRFVELIARFKLNRLHLHLSDDQGWRLAVDDWPTLTTIGGNSSVGGGFGGHFSRADYREIVAHAARHFVTVVPEIDMPGHTNAALTSVPALNPDGICPPPYTDKGVGFSSLSLTAPATRRFIADVIRQLAEDTSGEYLHIGGDEAHSTDHTQYLEFIALLQREVLANGKRMVGWEEIAGAPLDGTSLVQHWIRPEVAALAAAPVRFVMSPAPHTYLDMKHTPECPVGRRWAGFIDVDTAYGWDPAAVIGDVGDVRIAGVEAPLWTEKVVTFDQIEYLCFPRLACLGEVGWTAQHLRGWDGFRPRLAVNTDRLATIGVQVFRSSLLD